MTHFFPGWTFTAEFGYPVTVVPVPSQESERQPRSVRD